jgi:hypothetical protein
MGSFERRYHAVSLHAANPVKVRDRDSRQKTQTARLSVLALKNAFGRRAAQVPVAFVYVGQKVRVGAGRTARSP